MILFELDRSSSTPLHVQIVAETRARIVAGVVRPGEKLPSTRRLAGRLGVHRSTVALAYHELWSLGFVDLRPGASPRVRARKQVVAPAERRGEHLLDWGALATPAANRVREDRRDLPPRPPEAPARADTVSFAHLDVDPRLFPLDRFRTCLNRVMARKGTELLSYGDPMGYRPLREYVARRATQHGISVTPDEILLSNGSQHGSDLLLRVLASPGASVAVEVPTYNCMLPLLRSHGLEPCEIPLRGDGMDLDALATCLGRTRPMLVYTMPSFQNPTGLCTTQAHRERLLSLCEEHRVPLLEDGFEEEMQYSGKVVLPIKSMDRHQVVVYSGTFSKVLFSGLRIGWVAADRACIERMVAIRQFSEIAPNMVPQAALHEFCTRGLYDRHISRMHRVFRRRMRTALQALRKHVDPAWAEWSEPRGGYLIWLRVRSRRDPAPDLDALLAKHGVEATHGRFFFPRAADEPHLRLSISTLDEDEIEEGVMRLARALREAHDGR